MAGLIVNLFNTPPIPKNIKLQTVSGKDIDNAQGEPLNLLELKKAEEDAITYRLNNIIRGNVSPIYNCHGLTFANRRTCIINNDEIQNILNEEYGEIRVQDIIAGDVVIYMQDGEISHSGILVEVDKNIQHNIRVVSKWGRGSEYLHGLYNCPYTENLTIKFYRYKL